MDVSCRIGVARDDVADSPQLGFPVQEGSGVEISWTGRRSLLLNDTPLLHVDMTSSIELTFLIPQLMSVDFSSL
ncbi:hypothetical protein GW17_00056944 [Ensete ventricosum]|nr:hypothetical protein GW17_00056944 [Ensete ventricosum]